MEKNDEIVLEIEDTGVFYEGVAHADGLTCFVPTALQGETVRAKALKKQKGIAFMKVAEVIKPSPFRREARCGAFGKCGGCALLNVEYSHQLEMRKTRVLTALNREGVAVKNADVCPSNCEYRYRNKLIMPFGVSEGGKAICGLFAARSHRIIPITDCVLQPEIVNKTALEFCDFINAKNIPAYDETTRKGVVRRLGVRVLDGHGLVVAVGAKPVRREISAFSKVLERIFGGDYEFYYDFNPSTGNVAFANNLTFLGGKKRAVILSGLKLNAHPCAFFQVNDYVREELYKAVIEAAKVGDYSRIIDAYSGGGIMSALLSGVAPVAAVEIDDGAVESAKSLIKMNNINNVELIKGDCKDELSKLITGGELVVLDPPRAGCAREVLAACENAARIIYVSCDPATLSRDVRILGEYCFTTESVKVFDMFPNTANVETMLVLSRV